jgi:hypothetical protein
VRIHQIATPQFNPLIYSLEQSFPLVNLGVKEYWAPYPAGGSMRAPVLQLRILRTMSNATAEDYYVFRLCVPAILRLWLWLQVLTGWVVAGFTGIVKSN